MEPDIFPLALRRSGLFTSACQGAVPWGRRMQSSEQLPVCTPSLLQAAPSPSSAPCAVRGDFSPSTSVWLRASDSNAILKLQIPALASVQGEGIPGVPCSSWRGCGRTYQSPG